MICNCLVCIVTTQQNGKAQTFVLSGSRQSNLLSKSNRCLSTSRHAIHQQYCTSHHLGILSITCVPSQTIMARLFNILSFLSLLAFAWPLGTMARIILENTAIKSSSYNQPSSGNISGASTRRSTSRLLEENGRYTQVYGGLYPL
jgi:hypothetical protein